jgi:hypothetical protein
MKNTLLKMTLATLIAVINQPIYAQVIDDSTWEQVDLEKRIPILTQHASISACESVLISRLVYNAFKPSSPFDKDAEKNQAQMRSGLLADKEFSTAVKTYCASKYFSNTK